MGNVVLLTIDALRRDALGCYAGGDLTPNLDSMVDRGIRFSRALSTAPYTQAAFPGILTSSYYLEYGRQKELSVKRALISEALQKAGVVTAAFHSNAYLSGYFGWNRGWDVFYDSMDEDVTEAVPYVKALVLNQRAAEWLSSRPQKESPFFLWIHYMDVHEPYVPEKRHIEAVDPSLDLSQNQMMALFKNILLKRDVSDKEAVEILKKLYLAHVREVDEATGEFLEILRRIHLLEDTTLIITSDHGDEFAEHGGLSHDGKMFSELIDVPLIINTPGADGGVICDKLVSTIDISPTIAWLFGLQPEPTWQGRPLLPLDEYSNPGVFGEACDKSGSRETGQEAPVYYYVEENLKIVYRATDERWELYDLKQDPAEISNIVKSSNFAEEMRSKLKARIDRQSN